MPVVQAKNVKIGGRAILYEVQGDAIIFQFGDGQYSEAERDMIRDHVSNAIAFKLPDINDIIRKHSLNQSIITLPRPQAAYSDYQNKKKIGPCFLGTREALLKEMADWVSGMDDTRMYVLSGLAGIGKSTVAYTVAARADELGLLGASFFFSRDEAARSNAKMFFTAIAYQLCLYSDQFAQTIGEALLTRRGSAATMKDPQEQLEALILEPLRNIVQSRIRPILIVVDALDECDEEDADSVLSGLSRLVQALPAFNVILTTRPQPHVNHFFGRRDGHKIFRLHDIEDKVVDGDIRMYLQHALSLEQVQKQFSKRDWYASDEDIDFLVLASGRLFIIASTAVRLVLDKFASNPAAQMQKLLRAFSQEHTPFKDLDHFYTVILRNVVPVDCDNHDIVGRYQSVVGTIIFIQHPLPVTMLAHLIDINTEEIHAVLESLQSVILLGDDDIPRIYHKSFPDYVTDSARCKDTNLCIDPRNRQTQITIRCFRIMEQHLKYNLVGLGDLARFMNNEDGLAKDGITDPQLEDNIPQQLRYACIYWANHLDVATIEDADLIKELENFGDAHVLHWFEVLSLIRKLESAHRAIRIVLKHLKPASSDLYQVLSDGLRFISKFYEIIERSALHTYYSALAFTPTDSLLYHRYIKEAFHNFCDVKGVPKRWDALVANLNHGEWVRGVQFSLDNTMFASLSMGENGALKVWDTATGTPVSTIMGSGLRIANDFSTVASFKDNTIALHNVNGSERGATYTTQVTIFEVAISSESRRIAAHLVDGTLCLWDSGNGELIGSFDQFASYYRARHWYPKPDPKPDPDRHYPRDSLQFSSTGARLAYSSPSGIIHLRNGIDGSFIAYLNLDCESEFHRFAFSADGSRIATQSSLYLKLHRCEDGEVVGIANNTGSVLADLAVSADGSLLAAKEADGNNFAVKLWSGNSGNPMPLVEILDRDPWYMAFSLDDILAMMAFSSIEIYNVKTRSFISTLPCNRFSRTPTFSADCTHLATGSENGSVYLWDIRGIKSSSFPSNEQALEASDHIIVLALSPDCSRVACGFRNGKTELWETDDLAKQPIAAHRHHSRPIFTVKFSPDGSRYASGSSDGIRLWEGKGGALLGTLQSGIGTLYEVEFSHSALAAASYRGIDLWDSQTLDHIHTFQGSFSDSPTRLGFRETLSFSANGTLLVAAVLATPREYRFQDQQIIITVFDVTERTNIATFNIPKGLEVQATSFLPDNSHVVVLLLNGDFLTFDLVNNETIQGAIVEHLIQLPDFPVWHGVPVWLASHGEPEEYYLRALLSPHDDPLPVLWIPRAQHVCSYAQGRSVIALGCEDGRIILLRPGTSAYK
ncbi:hypothetical protein M378DRAFT_167497 [Amanita muscaria Koide BX008]|uniref:NACHT domain-containing protein n=1 Tax=Amanita muscaria (strain Koide BX008) TaxID=946122 RepID=A0A0C2WHP3_AMAMK|nr:hypothetical protein M378DRAFT_167497 [Amanita muscaria Koide BX008]